MVEAKDGFKRRIDYLRLSVTDRCNLRCVYCMPASGVKQRPHDEILTFEEIELFARCAIESGLSKIRLTGGEPLVRKDIVKLISTLCDIPELQDISITTNGLLLAEYAADLKAAGLKRVNVSLDSLDPDTFKAITRGGDVNQVMAGLEKAIEVGLTPVKVNAVAIRRLNQDFSAFADLAAQYPVHVRFIEYMPVGKDKLWSDAEFVTAEEIRAQLGALVPVDGQDRPLGWGPAVYAKREGSLGTIGFITPQSHHFCPECNRLRLTADGRLRLCLFSDEDLDVRAALRGGAGEKEIKELIALGLKLKPRARPEFGGVARTMSQIGG